jgi:transposase, IS5 family
VRVLTRLLYRARRVLGAQQIRFHDRRRRAKRRRKEINTSRRQEQRIAPYRDLIRVTHEVRSMAERALQAIPLTASLSLQRLRHDLESYLAVSSTVIDQARRRVLDGESIPATEKVASLFEQHAAIIRKGARETLYGHKACLVAGRSSIVLDAHILRGNPPDSTLPVSMIARLDKLLGQPPRQVAFDGGFSSISNLQAVKAAGVQDAVFAKGRGLRISDMAKSTWVYKRLRDFRAGIEGIISFLKRGFGLDRCTWRSWASFQSYVWSSIIASNLLIMARHLG